MEISTGMVYKPDSHARKESDKTKPWSVLAQYKLQAEDELAKIPGYVMQSLVSLTGLIVV